MHAILKVLRRPWSLHPGYWAPSLLIPPFIGFISIDFFRVAPYGVIDAAILARVFIGTIFLALFIQAPVLLISCVYLSRIKSRLGFFRFWVTFIILILISISIGPTKGKLEHSLSVDLFMASLAFLPLCWLTSWLFRAGNTENTTNSIN
jgi:hypothetical protein